MSTNDKNIIHDVDAETGEVIQNLGLPAPNLNAGVRHSLNYDYRTSKGERGGGRSMTTTEGYMSMTEIMSRYANGLPLSDNRPLSHVYTEDETSPNPRMMDKIDMAEYAEKISDYTEDKKSEIVELHKKGQVEKARKAIPPSDDKGGSKADDAKKSDGEKPEQAH